MKDSDFYRTLLILTILLTFLIYFLCGYLVVNLIQFIISIF